VSALRYQERGSSLVAAMLLIAVMMSIGLATASYVDGQQAQSGDERVRESAFNVAESALGAQVFQLSRAAWPTVASPLPAACTPSTSGTLTCPDAASLAESYKTLDYDYRAAPQCPRGGTAAPVWTTTVHDDSDGTPTGRQQNYNANKPDGTSQPKYDSNANNKMWVKATGTARCKQRTIVTAVEQGTRLLSFPKNVVTANWVATSNSGRKVIIDTQGNSAQTANVVARCTGSAPSPCLDFRTGQISPSQPITDPTTPATALPVGDLAGFKARAQANSTYYPAGTCPPSLTGAAVYVEDFTGCSAGDANSAAVPGALYIARGTLSLGGNTRVYGLVYMGNLQGSTGAVVSLGGNARIEGAVAIDGAGGLVVGSSKKNLVFDSRVFDSFQGVGAVTITPNTWRELKPGS